MSGLGQPDGTPLAKLERLRSADPLAAAEIEEDYPETLRHLKGGPEPRLDLAAALRQLDVELEERLRAVTE